MVVSSLPVLSHPRFGRHYICAGLRHCTRQALKRPTVADGVVYVTSMGQSSENNKLHAVKVASGTKKWTYTTGKKVRRRAPPRRAPRTVFVRHADFTRVHDTSLGGARLISR
eukprot:2526816-Prymnesium_polylepis.1